MDIEAKVLNLFLHQKQEGTEHRVWMAYNFTEEQVFSWRESLSPGVANDGGSVNLGLNHEPEEISRLIRKTVEEMHFSFPVTKINLHNEGDYEGGEKDKLPEQLHYQIHSFLRSHPPKIHIEPKVYLTSSRN